MSKQKKSSPSAAQISSAPTPSASIVPSNAASASNAAQASNSAASSSRTAKASSSKAIASSSHRAAASSSKSIAKSTPNANKIRAAKGANTVGPAKNNAPKINRTEEDMLKYLHLNFYVWSKASFARLIRMILCDLRKEDTPRLTAAAVDALQEACNYFLHQYFEHCQIFAQHRGRITVSEQDSRLAMWSLDMDYLTPIQKDEKQNLLNAILKEQFCAANDEDDDTYEPASSHKRKRKEKDDSEDDEDEDNEEEEEQVAKRRKNTQGKRKAHTPDDYQDEDEDNEEEDEQVAKSQKNAQGKKKTRTTSTGKQKRHTMEEHGFVDSASDDDNEKEQEDNDEEDEQAAKRRKNAQGKRNAHTPDDYKDEDDN